MGYFTQPRTADGRYGAKRKLRALGFISIIAIGAFFIFGHPIVMQKLDTAMHYERTPVSLPIAEAAEDRAAATVKELKAEMIGKIWGDESQKFQPAEGEVWMIYDPPRTLRESGKCQQGNTKLPWECFSFGPMQWKIETLQGFYSQIHAGQTITEMEAMTIANDLTQAQDLAFQCWVEVEGCIWHWTTASKYEEYFRTVLPIVRKLQQE
jgi:hypothetical protein